MYQTHGCEALSSKYTTKSGALIKIKIKEAIAIYKYIFEKYICNVGHISLPNYINTRALNNIQNHSGANAAVAVV